MPSFTIIASNGVPVRIDWPTMACCQATDVAVVVEADLQPCARHRAVVAAAHVVLARPDHLDRRLPPIALARLDRLDDDVGIGHRAPAEAAAGLHHMQRRPSPASTPAICADRLVEVGHLVPAQISSTSPFSVARPRSAAPSRRARDRGTRSRPRWSWPPWPARRRRRRRCAADRRARLVRQLPVFGEELGGAALLGRAVVPVDLRAPRGPSWRPRCSRRPPRRRAGSAPRRRRPHRLGRRWRRSS